MKTAIIDHPKSGERYIVRYDDGRIVAAHGPVPRQQVTSTTTTADLDDWLDNQFGADLEDTAAWLRAALAYHDGSLDLAACAEADHAAQDLADDARRALRAAVTVLVEEGMSESEAARMAGVTRMTVRSWMGK